MKYYFKNIQMLLISKLLLLAMLLITACSKNLLDTVPDTNISDATAFDTPERVQAQVVGLYAGLKSANFYGGRYLIFNELRADEFLMGKPDPGQASNVWSHTVNSGSGEVINMWSAGYTTINRVNTFLAGLEEKKEVISEELYNQYVAEAKFIRAISYFGLVQVYAKPYNLDNGASPGLPLRLQKENSSDNNDLARSSVAAIYDQILKDLDEAEPHLPISYSSTYNNAVKAHRNSAIALKTRVYLHMGKYEEVVDEAEKIVSLPTMSATSGVQHTLESDFSELFTGNYTGPEAIFYMPFSAANSGSLITFYFRAPPAAGSEYYLNHNGIITDAVFSNPDDKRSELVIDTAGFKWLNKFVTGNPNTDFVPVIRYAEVLLNYAEAAAQTNDYATSAALLEAIRHRSDPSYTFNSADLNDKSALLDLIINERRIELLGEGFRVPDLQRQLLPIPGKAAPQGVAPELSVSSALYIWPISSEEIGTNQLMDPN